MEEQYIIPIQTSDGKKIRLQIKHKNANAKKRKVKTWTVQQDNLLIQLYQKHPKKWANIAQQMGDRNQNQCLHRYRRLSQLGINRKIWSAEQDQTIKKLIKKVGKNWKLLSQMIGTKTGKQIRQRFINKLDPKIKRQEWSDQQDRKIIQLYAEIGSKWSEISKKIPGRPENKIKNRFYSYIQKNYDIKYKTIEEDNTNRLSFRDISNTNGINKTFGQSNSILNLNNNDLFQSQKINSANLINFSSLNMNNVGMSNTNFSNLLSKSLLVDYNVSQNQQNISYHQSYTNTCPNSKSYPSIRQIQIETNSNNHGNKDSLNDCDNLLLSQNDCDQNNLKNNSQSRIYLKSLVNMDQEWLNNMKYTKSFQNFNQNQNQYFIHDFFSYHRVIIELKKIKEKIEEQQQSFLKTIIINLK